MKRYLLFAYYEDSEQGGINDLIGNYQTIEEAQNKINTFDFEIIYHLHDIIENRKILTNEQQN